MARGFRRQIHVLGGVAATAYAALALLSHVQAPVLWQASDAPRAAAFYAGSGAGRWLPALARLVDDKTAVVVSFVVPLAIASLVAFLAIRAIARQRGRDDVADLRPLVGWSCAFAAICFLGMPVFTQDFWLSAVWGRMIAAGVNPYHTLFTPEWMTGLPLDHFPILMTYGPLWGAISAGVTLLAGSDAMVTALLLKVVLAAAWGGSLLLIVRTTRDCPAAHRLLAVAVFGWTPLGATQFLLEGHNDIAMASFALLWLFLLFRGRGTAPLGLAASVLCKFVTAPLFLVDAIDAFRRQKCSWRRYALRLVPGVLLILIGVGIFFRSAQFFEGLKQINEWRFLRPVDALAALERLAGYGAEWASYVVLAIFPAIAVWTLADAIRRPGIEATIRAALALMMAGIFAAASHVWPWYAIWILAPAALLPHWWLSRYAIGFSVLAPFTIAFWWVPALEDKKEVAALLLYGGAVLWAILTRAAPPMRTAAADFPESRQNVGTK